MNIIRPQHNWLSRFSRYTTVIGLLSMSPGWTGCKDTATGTAPLPRSDQKTITAGGHASTNPNCPSTAIHHGDFPAVSPEYRTLNYWLSRWSQAELDQPLLSTDDIARQNRAVGLSGKSPVTQWNLLDPIPRVKIAEDSKERFDLMGQRLKNRELVTENGAPVPPPLMKFVSLEAGTLRSDSEPPIWLVALSPVQIRCIPFDGPLYSADSDRAFDKNACSTVSPQEPFEVLGRWKNKMLFIRTRYAFGFIRPDAAVSPDVDISRRSAYMNAPAVRTEKTISADCNGETIQVPAYTILPIVNGHSVLVAGRSGFCTPDMPSDTTLTARPLTRRSFYETAFQYLDAAYGYGGSGNGMDCSRYVMNVLSAFHLFVPRNSAAQSQAGSFSLDVSQVTDLEQKLNYLNMAAQQGVVALYFPGHIMFYLGQTDDGVPMAIHSLGEYVRPCTPEAPDRGETVFRVKKVVVTDLSLGLGSSRKSFLERLTRIVVFGEKAGKTLDSLVRYRAAEPPALPSKDACSDSVQLRIFQSPRRLIIGEPARLIATGQTPSSRATLQIYAPDGSRITHQVHPLPGPPVTRWARFTPDATGTYTVVLGDGNTMYACDRFSVRTWRDPQKPRVEPGPYWQTRWKWEQDTENFFAAFVEQLFSFPPDVEISWRGLQTLLSDPDKNLLFNHLGDNEDTALNLNPDCADLPYFLRAYFSWKTGLPFGIRSCSRGREGRPPSCTEFQTNDQEAPFAEELDNESKIFERFANVVIGWNAHSASSRTHPGADDSDFYPVSLQKNALPPGTVFTDPYGHVMIVSQWVPQPLGGYGILMAVDAQPDGTIGRRRFWRGDFLFDNNIDSYGAGFKRFRPIVIEPREVDGEIIRVARTLENRELKRSRIFSRYSMAQYKGDVEDFYRRMQQLINPTPLNPEKLLRSRIDAFYDTVKRRVQAVDIGEKYMVQKEFAAIEMPEGAEIFQTEGPWEDYATPSRDMRLLIAMDAVLSTPDTVRQAPEQFGISKGSEINRVISRLISLLESEFDSKFIEYTRTDQSRWRLTLSEIIHRGKALELAYNPNDCPEIRWGAPEKSDERNTCKRSAPSEQLSRMKQYRQWFHTRTRPIRP